jgi:hypothetical protein
MLIDYFVLRVRWEGADFAETIVWVADLLARSNRAASFIHAGHSERLRRAVLIWLASQGACFAEDDRDIAIPISFSSI